MSLRIIRAGLLDTIQDTGRNGYQQYGINPGGAMDLYSAQLANALLGNALEAAVIELHFPAAQVLFEKDTIICIAGADFSPTVNNKPVPLHHPIAVSENSLLKFERLQSGARAYLSLYGGLKIEKWLNSYSTHLKAACGGFQGRALARYDGIDYSSTLAIHKILGDKEFLVLPWKANETVENSNEIECVIGNEWFWLSREMQEEFQGHWYQITHQSDRMGYRLAGMKLEATIGEQLVSSAVSSGTVQLLPSGQLIVLMADHQTTGGYPRIAHIISAHLPILAQKKPNDVMRFSLTDLTRAEEKLEKQQKYLLEIQIACKFRMQNLLYADL